MTLVTFEWEVTDFDDTEVTSQFKLYKDGAEVLSVVDTGEAVYALNEEGKYIAEVCSNRFDGCSIERDDFFQSHES